MERLRHLARRGTTVVCTTHLMDNLGLFDEIVALGVRDGVGRLAYAGASEGLLPHSGHRSFADLNEALDGGKFRPVGPSPRDPARDGDGQGPQPVVPGARRDAAVVTAEGPGFDAAAWGQTGVVAVRDLRLLLRDRGFAAALLVQPVALGVLVCLTQYDASKPVSLLFFLVVVATWLGLNGSARDLVRERRLYARDRLAGLRPAAYLGAKAAVHAAIGAVQVAALLTAVGIACLKRYGPTWRRDWPRSLRPGSSSCSWPATSAASAWACSPRRWPAPRRRPWRPCRC